MASIPGVSIMAALVAAAGLDAALASQPATVFAPTDAAFMGSVVPGMTLEAVANSSRALGNVVRCAHDQSSSQVRRRFRVRDLRRLKAAVVTCQRRSWKLDTTWHSLEIAAGMVLLRRSS